MSTKITIAQLDKNNMMKVVDLKKINNNIINFDAEKESELFYEFVDTKYIRTSTAEYKISAYLRKIDFSYKNNYEEKLKRYTYVNDKKLFNTYNGYTDIKALNVGDSYCWQTFETSSRRYYDINRILFYVVDIDDDYVYIVTFYNERDLKSFLTKIRKIVEKEAKEEAKEEQKRIKAEEKAEQKRIKAEEKAEEKRIKAEEKAEERLLKKQSRKTKSLIN